LKKIVTVLGARPQFIKASMISKLIKGTYKDKFKEVIIHTGQHFDPNMSEVFFDELDLPRPKINLGISGGSHSSMTAAMLISIEQVMLEQKPDWILIYGDTNSTLAGALVAAKMGIPLAHVEAGLRSFNNDMPEEINRIISDRVSQLLFCPTNTAKNNLNAEGITCGVHNVGDVMLDVSLNYREIAKRKSMILKDLNLKPHEFILATCHRAENTDDTHNLYAILSALSELAKNMNIVLPLHPRTKQAINKNNFSQLLNNITVCEPLSFLDMINLEQNAKLIITDSGGVQKEAFFFQIPCLTIRDETEWVETVELGCNSIIGANYEKIISYSQKLFSSDCFPKTLLNPYGDGDAANKIISFL